MSRYSTTRGARAGRAAIIVSMALWCAGPAVGAPGLPLRDGRPVVASVGGDPIWLDELARELGATADRARLQQGRATPAELEVLDRLVTVRLIVKEATAMGLADAPEIRKQVEVTSREILREVLFARLTAGLTPDPAVVDRVYKDLVREWKTSALLFEDKAAAERARKEIAAGAAFDQVAARALSSKAARPNGDNDYHPKSAYLPQVAGALATLAAGQVSPVIQIPSGFVVLRVVDVRYPQNAEALAEARKQALVERQEKTLRAHEAALRRQYVTLHKAVLDSIDYEAPKPGLNALLKDKRVIADIKGSQPVTVADLTDYLRMQFFHGTDDPRERRRMNSLKGSALDAMIGRRLSNAEAVRIGIDRTPEYRERVRGYRDSLVFDAFVQKVIVPPNKMTETEVRKYYDTHLKEYSSPEMLRVRGLAFTRRAAAEDAARKLREGADFGWLSAHAEGQAPKGTDGLLTFDGRPLIVGSLPEGLRKALAGARAGESRLYASPEGPAYVLAVQGVVPPTPQPYEQVRDEIAKKLYNEKLKKAVAAYADRLRAQTKVETYLTRVR